MVVGIVVAAVEAASSPDERVHDIAPYFRRVKSLEREQEKMWMSNPL
jgi:hypothetical protein